MKKGIIIAVAVLIILCLVLYSILPVPSGYAAKNMCSSVFLAGLEKEYVETHDLDFSLVAFMHTEVDYEDQSATASFLGLRHNTAHFRNAQTGCTLGEIEDESEVTFEAPPLQADTLVWPYGTMEQIAPIAAMDELLAEQITNGTNETRALLVVYKDRIVGEQYAEGFDKHSLMLGWSMTKSITSTLVGLLAAEGTIDINSPAPVPEWQGDERSDITWKDLLQMQSGLEWSEIYSLPSDVNRMLYRESDVYRYAINTPLEEPPGTSWEYSSGTTNILSGLIRQALGEDEEYHNYPYRTLFSRIGADSFVMEMDAAGNFIGSSYSYATARDWAKFGLLYLHRGKWNGEQILPEWWIDFVSTPAEHSAGRYGAQFWLNIGGTMQNAPPDLFYCQGFGGQQVFIIPSLELVVVRLGLDSMDFNGLLRNVIAIISE